MSLAKLIETGRVVPILKPSGKGYDLVVGYRRPAKSRKRGGWTLKEARPYQVPLAVLRATRGAEMVDDARQHTAELTDMLDLARPGEIWKAAECYSGLATRLEAGGEYAEIMAQAEKHWPWSLGLWMPSKDLVYLYATAGGLYWADADRLKQAGNTKDLFVRSCYAVDVCAKEIDRVLAKPVDPAVQAAVEKWGRAPAEKGAA